MRVYGQRMASVVMLAKGCPSRPRLAVIGKSEICFVLLPLAPARESWTAHSMVGVQYALIVASAIPELGSATQPSLCRPLRPPRDRRLWAQTGAKSARYHFHDKREDQQ